MTPSRHTRLAAALLLLAQGGVASADDVAGILRRGFDLRRQHRNEEALVAYEEAFAIAPTPAVRAQKGLAEQTLGHWAIAERDLDASLATRDPWVERNRESLEAARALIRDRLAWLTVSVDVAGVEIQLDGEPMASGVETRVLAGAGVIEVRAPGFVPDIRRVSLAPAEHVRQRIALAPLVSATPQSAPSTVALLAPEPIAPTIVPPPPALPALRTQSGAAPILPIVLGVAGAAGIVTGAWFGVRTFRDKSREQAECAHGCTPAAADDYSDGRSSATISTVAIGAGAALVGGGIVAWLLGRGKREKGDGRVEVAPIVGVQAGGIVVEGSL